MSNDTALPGKYFRVHLLKVEKQQEIPCRYKLEHSRYEYKGLCRVETWEKATIFPPSHWYDQIWSDIYDWFYLVASEVMDIQVTREMML